MDSFLQSSPTPISRTPSAGLSSVPPWPTFNQELFLDERLCRYLLFGFAESSPKVNHKFGRFRYNTLLYMSAKSYLPLVSRKISLSLFVTAAEVIPGGFLTANTPLLIFPAAAILDLDSTILEHQVPVRGPFIDT